MIVPIAPALLKSRLEQVADEMEAGLSMVSGADALHEVKTA